MSEHGKRPSAVLREQLPQVRARLDMSAQQLADRIEAHGGGLDRAAISKIETGKRGVSLDEALQLAAALGIAPLHLFIPREDDADVLATPNLAVSVVQAREWVRGQEPLPGMSEKVFRTEVPESEWRKSRQMSEREKEARAAVDRARRQLRVADQLREMREHEYDKVKHLAGFGHADHDGADRKLDESLAAVAEARVEVEEAEARYRLARHATPEEIKAFVEQAGGKVHYVPREEDF